MFLLKMNLYEEKFSQMGSESWIPKCDHVRNTKENCLLLEPDIDNVVESLLISLNESDSANSEGFLQSCDDSSENLSGVDEL